MWVWALGTEIEMLILGERFRVETGGGFGDRYGGVLGQTLAKLLL